MKAITYPRTGSLASRALARLLRDKHLSHRNFDAVSRSYRLSGYIHYLRKKHNWPVESQPLSADTMDPVGRQADYCIYFLHEKDIKWAGKQGIEYSDSVLGWENKRESERLAATKRSENCNTASEDNITPVNLADRAHDGKE